MSPEQAGVIAADNPIEDAANDTLGRAALAARFADQVLAQDVSRGLAVGVLGAWGSGKTSFINLARKRFADAGAPTLDFNPWMFSGAEQLVNSFFIELAAQLKVRPDLAEIGAELEDYGEAFSGLAWLPLVGPWIERGRLASKLLSKLLQRRKEGIGPRRSRLEGALAALEQPIIVVLDDIDRLTPSEVRDVFKLVRLTASFPNVVYIVAFDRARVEDALSQDGLPGRDYLEKILQVAVDLPSIPGHVLNRQIFAALDQALSTVEDSGQLDQEAWPDVFMEIIRPLIRNMRDVRRYAVAVQGTVDAIEGQIALVDVLALEAVRVFLPDVFGKMHGTVDGLTTPAASFGSGGEPPELKAQIAALIDAAAERDDVVRAMISRLFPAAQRHVPGGMHYGGSWAKRWLRERRVAHVEILRLYLERVAGEGLQAFREAEQAWAAIGSQEELDRYLRSLPIERLEDVIGALETYEDEFSAEHAVPAATVLLNLLPDLPERHRGMFAMDTRLVVSRVVYRFLRAVGDPTALEVVVSTILPQVSSLSSKLEVITDVGYREGAGHQLVTESAARGFETAWREEVQAAHSEQLVKEPDLLRVLLLAKRDAGPSEDPLIILDSPEMTLALLRSARSDVRSQSVGTRAVRRSPRLVWDALIELYDDETSVKQRIEGLKASGLECDEGLLELADKYSSGWRPKDFGDD